MSASKTIWSVSVLYVSRASKSRPDSVNSVCPASVDETSVPSNIILFTGLPCTNILSPFAGASVKVNVVPLIVQTVVPVWSTESVLTLLNVRVTLASLFELTLVSVNTFVSPSPITTSLSTFSKIIVKGSKWTFVSSSRISVSVVIDESSNVPVSNWIPPPIILTKPSASLISVSALAEVKVSTSPTSYFEPTSSTSTPLTEPVLIPLTIMVAKPLPTFSTSTSSKFECNIPSLTTTPDENIDVKVNATVTSLCVDVPVTSSPLVKVPIILEMTNSVTDTVPCWNEICLSTVAVAPELCPVISWLTTSSPETPKFGWTLIIVVLPQLPSEALIIYWLG